MNNSDNTKPAFQLKKAIATLKKNQQLKSLIKKSKSNNDTLSNDFLIIYLKSLMDLAEEKVLNGTIENSSNLEKIGLARIVIIKFIPCKILIFELKAYERSQLYQSDL